MLDTERADFAKTLLGVANYYGKELDKAVIEVYWQGLREYDLQAVQKALWAHTRNPDSGQFMPKIADVCKQLEGRTEDQATAAWSKVDMAVRRVGIYQDVVFDDPLIHRVLSDMGGWTLINSKDDKEWPFVAKEFMTRYRGYRMRGETPEYNPVLVGLANAQNQRSGFRSNPPILVGNEADAVKVLKGGTDRALIGITPANELTMSAVQLIGSDK